MDQVTQASSGSSAGAQPLSTSPDWSGRNLGDFHLLRRLGQGGMGQVYLAEQISLKRKVAIKTMRTDLAVSAVSLQRFKAEAEAIARVSHANIVQVYAIGEEAGLHYMVLEYVEGRNLREFLTKKGPPDLALALRIIRQVAAALLRASELGIIHRDIKPENILLTKRGEIKVADFGLSRCFAGEASTQNLTQTGMTLGTPLYMSPEQVQGQPLDPRTDIYSFGVTCYHLVTGRPPFAGQTPFEVALHHVQTEPAPLSEVRPDLPPELCAIIHKMMAKNLEKRYQNCAELLKDLNQLRESLTQKTQIGKTTFPALAPSSSTVATIRPARSSRSWTRWAAATVGLALLGGGATAWLRSSAMKDSSSASPVAIPAATSDGPLLTEQRKKEQFLREAVEQYADPGNDRTRRNLGLQHSLELTLFYLQEDRLEEADEFFGRLVNNPAKFRPYQTLGRLGHAIVLARQNRPAESIPLLIELLSDKPKAGPEQIQMLLNQPQLRYELARALEYNKANLRNQPLPAELERFRQPPRSQQASPPPGGGKRP